MNFKDININKSYINKGDNSLLNSFFNPLFSNAVSYKASVGYFSSSVITVIQDSLCKFINNNGKISIIVSTELAEGDVEAIKYGYELREKLINDKFIKEFNICINDFSNRELEILANLVAQNILDIRIAVVKNDVGIYHDKLGIFTDTDNDIVVFYGSANFTKAGYTNNYEKIRIARSWNIGETESVLDEVTEFDNLWNNRNNYVEVYNFMDSIRKNIINVCNERGIFQLENNKKIELYDYQKEAIDKWKKNEYNGFFVMATGTGKTLTALYGIKTMKEEKRKLVVLVAPYRHLIKQWENDINNVFPESKVVLFSSDYPKKYDAAIRAIISQKYDDSDIFFVTTIDTFLSDDFEKIVLEHKYNKIIVVDEAHRFNNRPNWADEIFKYRLGLSATPLNGKNNAKGLELIKYFGGIVYSLTIEDALKKNCLVNYKYNPIFVSANEDEEKIFKNISYQMSMCFDNKGILIDKEKYNLLYRSRLRVIATTKEKLDRIEEFILKIQPKDHFIVYCGDGKINITNNLNGDKIRNIDFVKEKLDKLGYKASQFTCDEDIKTRMKLVDIFNRGIINSMVAIRCLDEGINIPSISSALILASNDDYREFVQRRGRILRKYEGKELAEIFDIIVLPKDVNSGIARIELRRFKEYAKLSINKEDNLKILENLKNKYNLCDSDIDFDLNYDEEEEIDE